MFKKLAPISLAKSAALNAIALAALLVGTTAQAFPAVPEACAAGSLTATFTNLSTASYTACSGAWVGNVNPSSAAAVSAQIFSDFGLTASFFGKSDDAGNGPFTSNPSTTSGTLTFDSARLGFFVIGLKSSTNFSLYEFNGGSLGISSIKFDTFGVGVNKNGKSQDLSHAALYAVTVVPEPESYALMLAGLAGIGFVARRRHNA